MYYEVRRLTLRILIPCSFLGKYECFGGTFFLHVQGKKIQTSILEANATGSSETSLHIYQAEDHNLNNYRCERPRSHTELHYSPFLLPLLSLALQHKCGSLE
jgi:hypothetical protein